MLRKFKKIDNFGVFKQFNWDKDLENSKNFQHINIIYGRNYSGKTTLSRIVRALETGNISDKFENPSFTLELAEKDITQEDLRSHGKQIRVFNQDFVRSNLHFITRPDDSIESFAILGDDNNKIEEEIHALEKELGTKESGKETGFYAEQIIANKEHDESNDSFENAKNKLETQLKKKATDPKTGIKYDVVRFGDQNYDITKLKNEIEIVQKSDYHQPTQEEVIQHDKLINEKTLSAVTAFQKPIFNLQTLSEETEKLITKKISESNKIEELVMDAVLNRWVKEGRKHYKNKPSKCGFCNNPISEDRWKELEKHFDEESERLESFINDLISKINEEKRKLAGLSINKNIFYSKFHERLDQLEQKLKEAIRQYEISLNKLIEQLQSRKDNIIHQALFEKPFNNSDALQKAWDYYETIRQESNKYTSSLENEQRKAKKALRLQEVSKFIIDIEYEKQCSDIKSLEEILNSKNTEKESVNKKIFDQEALIASKKNELKDEEQGASKVNEYLNNFFGHPLLKLEAKNEEKVGENLKKIRFEVMRDSKKAYHLSEGECSLLAFCYFLAKLDDIDTQNSKPIIWIDDPISSLDGNHIFFVYSLIRTQIVSVKKFEQLFVSTHNLEFLKYLKRLKGCIDNENKKSYEKGYFFIHGRRTGSAIQKMPQYLQEYATEFNYLFHQIFKCSQIESPNDDNYEIILNFGNNARKFFEIYLYYKYPDKGMNEETLTLFFDKDSIPAILLDRINNEYSHLSGTLERGATPVESLEMQKAAEKIISYLKKDEHQYNGLLQSIGEKPETMEEKNGN